MDAITDEDGPQIIRAKWILDGAATLAEAAQKARDFAAHLQELHDQGYTFERPVEGDYGYLIKRDE